LSFPRRGHAAHELPPPALHAARARLRVRRDRSRSRRIRTSREGQLPLLLVRRRDAPGERRVKPRAEGFAFHVLCNDPTTRARRSVLRTPHGDVDLPTFMPVGTQGSVKGLSMQEVATTGAKIVLGNTYHLWLRPGEDAVA